MPDTQVITPRTQDLGDTARNLNRWLEAQGEAPTAVPAAEAMDFEKIPGSLMITVTLPDGRVATCLMDLQHNYLAGDEVWPWSWR